MVWGLIGCVAVALLLLMLSSAIQPRLSGTLHVAIVLLLLPALALAWLAVHWQSTELLLHGAMQVDGLAIVLLSGVIVALLLAGPISGEFLLLHGLVKMESFALLLLMVAGIVVICTASDGLVMLLGLEIAALASYALLGMVHQSGYAQEAAWKYFCTGAVSTACWLFGLSLLYGAVGTVLGQPSVGFAAITASFSQSSLPPLAYVGVACMWLALWLKLAIVPFHMWAPDVYVGASPPIAAWLAVFGKLGAFAALVRFTAAICGDGGSASWLIIGLLEGLGVVTLLLGNALALRQVQVLRFLAYSSIAQSGYFLLGLAAWLADANARTLLAMGLYGVTYALMTLGLFGLVLMLWPKQLLRGGFPLSRLHGLAWHYPWLGVLWIGMLWAMAGLPLSGSFAGKLGLLYGLLQSERIFAAFGLVLGSLLGAAAYLRVGARLFAGQSLAMSAALPLQGTWLRLGLWSAFALLLLLGIWPSAYEALLQPVFADAAATAHHHATSALSAPALHPPGTM